MRHFLPQRWRLLPPRVRRFSGARPFVGKFAPRLRSPLDRDASHTRLLPTRAAPGPRSTGEIVMLRLITGLLLAAAAVPRAYAAESYDYCPRVISSLPATISTQGTWCLKSNLSTGITTGNAITIATNNVTIDCNDYKLGRLPAGDATNAV